MPIKRETTLQYDLFFQYSLTRFVDYKYSCSIATSYTRYIVSLIDYKFHFKNKNRNYVLFGEFRIFRKVLRGGFLNLIFLGLYRKLGFISVPAFIDTTGLAM